MQQKPLKQHTFGFKTVAAVIVLVWCWGSPGLAGDKFSEEKSCRQSFIPSTDCSGYPVVICVAAENPTVAVGSDGTLKGGKKCAKCIDYSNPFNYKETGERCGGNIKDGDTKDE